MVSSQAMPKFSTVSMVSLSTTGHGRAGQLRHEARVRRVQRDGEVVIVEHRKAGKRVRFAVLQRLGARDLQRNIIVHAAR